jgi:general L-amino acid transport system permease protein
MSVKSVSRLWYDLQFRRTLIQLVALTIMILFVVFIVRNTQINLERLNIQPGFAFLDDIAGFMATFPNLNLTGYDVNKSTHLDVYFTGIANTLLVAVAGIFLTTIIGFTMGVLRLSNNVLVSFFASAYVEGMRNVPVLLWILIWYFAVFLNAPGVRDSVNLFDVFYFNQRYIAVPQPIFHQGFWMFPAAVGVAIVAFLLLWRRAKLRQQATGEILPVLWPSLGLLVGLPAIALLVTDFPVTWEIPALKGFNFRGGIQLPSQYSALVIALSAYTGAYIAELVRAGIESVDRGQIDAAKAIGLKNHRIMTIVVIPQAMRVIIPPLTSQYLNLIKDSSLAVAIGYMDIVNVFAGVSLMQTGNALEVIAMTMLVYATLSLIISVIMNIYNNRMKIVER